MKRQLYSQISKDGGRPCHEEGEVMVAAPGLVKRGEGGNYGSRPLLWFLWEGMRKAREAGLKLASLHNFSRL